MVSGVVQTAIMAFDLKGVWRLENISFHLSDPDVETHIRNESFMLQPESIGYALIELKAGKCYLIKNVHPQYSCASFCCLLK